MQWHHEPEDNSIRTLGEKTQWVNKGAVPNPAKPTIVFLSKTSKTYKQQKWERHLQYIQPRVF